ncbi:MAG: carotenoid oxygenase family protein [Nitrospirota bacterium]|nr:carotenoid oxygenase family protein [Nitrospirota bacterium]
MLTRRGFLQLSGAAGFSLLLNGCSAKSLPLSAIDPDESRLRDMPFLGLAESLTEEYDYEAVVEGKVPDGLRGVLYRNGPALFDRGGLRKRAIQDGDGMVQAFFFHDKGVRFRNKFVRTEKYVEESAAGRFLYPSWSTQAPGGFWANFWAGDKMKSQAAVNVFLRNGRLIAFDESNLPYELDPVTLETKGSTTLGLPEGTVVYSAHPKIDPRNGEWLHFGLHYGRRATLHITVFDRKGALIRHQKVPLPRYVYFHDFFVSGRHLIFHLHPVKIDLPDFLLGRRSLAESLRWKPEEGDLLLVADRYGAAEPVSLAVAPSFMWHSINAYEQNNEIIADFIGYETPDHFIGPDPVIFAVMAGRRGRNTSKGELRRYVISLPEKKVRQEIIGKGGYEWPVINEAYRCGRYRIGYCAKSRGDDFFWSGITRFDASTYGSETCFFEEGLYCGEPVFAGRPDFRYSPDASRERGWLLTEVYDSHTRKSFLSIFSAEDVSGGPVANVYLQHHVPFSYHGHWYGGS